MSNININNSDSFKIRISKSDYWDFKLAKSDFDTVNLTGGTFFNDYLISEFNFNTSGFSPTNKIYSSNDFKWEDSINNGLVLNDIGYTGIDNGMILFDKQNISNNEFRSLLTGSTYIVNSGDTRLVLDLVSGNTGDYVYPVNFVTGVTGNYIELRGGFFQGIFKSGDDYQILPYEFDNELCFDLLLKPVTIADQDNTLNKNHTDNKGIFLYLGLRAENKFLYEYEHDLSSFTISKTGQTSPAGVSGITGLIASDGLPIVSQDMYELETDNKYLLINRAIGGLTAVSFDPNATYSITGKTKPTNINLYNYINRTPTGYTALSCGNIPGSVDDYNIISDIVRNAICFRITDDNRIGYRMITDGDCEDNLYLIEEEYSQSGVTYSDENNYVFIRIKKVNGGTCIDKNDKIKILFYINNKLVFVSKELDIPLFKKINDRDVKQEGAPFVISLGGGTQGLCDMIGFNSNSSTQYLLPIEQYFAGTFIGDLYHFRIHYGKMSANEILNNYNFYKTKVY